MKTLAVSALAAVLCAAAAAPLAQAQPAAPTTNAFPSKPIRLLVGFAAGGSVDNAARIVAHTLTAAGWTVVVENRTGASGIIATRELARSSPDGYTLMVGSVGNLAIVPAGMKDAQVDVLKDLTPVAQLGSAPLLLLVNPKVPVNSLADVIKLAKSKTGSLDYASGGVGTPPHMAGELLASAAGISLNHISYRGEAPALADVIGGHVPMLFANFTAAFPQVQDHTLRAVAVTSAARSPALPDVPTVAESGLADFAVENWYGIVAPAGVPASIVNEIHQKVVNALNLPSNKEQFAAQGFTVSSASPAQFGEHMKSEFQKWSGIIRARNITLN
jgi:tripartite-type tricarboxylate transporter receptor subunit TctC